MDNLEYFMTTRSDGKHITQKEFRDADFYTMVEHQFRFLREEKERKRKEELNIVQETPPDNDWIRKR